ncbi:probable glycosyltransferase At3g07620 [Diospyros lotus]|uniref:probable glycosyltransferase At3g07620 n=1 Tax=Diospyros lotus TaxID=55363 RepID=UPI00224CCCFB|nr:probable glycosyltransferase At3g07620 [Diospyros lotus]
MKVAVQIQRLFHVKIQRLLLTIATVVEVVVVFQFLVSPNKNYISNLWDASNGSVVTVGNVTFSSSSKLTGIGVIHGIVNNSMASDSEGEGKDGDGTQMEGMEKDSYFQVDGVEEMDNSFQIDEDGQSSQEITSESSFDHDKSLRYVEARNINTSFSILGEVHSESSMESLRLVSQKIPPNVIADLDAGLRTPLSSIAGNASSAHNNTALVEIQPGHTNKELLGNTSTSPSNNSLVSVDLIMKGRRRRRKPTTISDMTLLLLQSLNSSSRPQRSSPRDRELQYARSQIQNAPVIRSSPELYASLFRNYSMFRRSYELMERMLKVYIYKEGEKPIFHQPRLKGIYASEGWFMQLIERNKQFVVRDPRKAHLFYLPFSSKNLRIALQQKQFTRDVDLEEYLKNYTDIIAKKYHFLNREKGADHFLVACHDWAPWLTRKSMGNFIRVLCNANVARDFRIGKDVSLPMTNIRSAQDPGQDLGGKPPSQRTILAFFAGNMHGYLRPVLLQHWENKEPDMKISGPMPRDREGTKYRESMKSSKYCVCARGTGVHSPRVVEAIYHECVPVIISDNYEPPFFEVLEWEAFSVFVLEKDIPNLRNILLSIPEDRYLAMQQRVKLVQQHFLWHRKPAKYDLFHMILHSVWYNRVLQVKL